MPKTAMFEIEREGATIIVIPAVNLRELDDVASNAREAIDALSDLSIKNLVMDFHKTDYFGSTALALFIRFWKILADRSGHMAFCNLSDLQREVLSVTRLDTLWPICESREQAMKAVRKLNRLTSTTATA